MWLYDGVVDGVSEHCQYTKYDNNPYVNPNFNESAFKKDSFYAQSGPATKSPSGYFDNPASLYKFLGYETINGNQILKYETYSWVMKPGAAVQKNCLQCNTKAGEYFDSTTGLCVNKCEDITNQSDRLNCMCKRAGKIGYSGDFVTMRIFPDGPHDDHFLCNYGCETTKDDPEARPNGDYTKYSVSYDIKDTDPNANGVCFADDTYAPNAMPSPNPKPDDPGNNNGTKPGGDTPKPDKPDKPDTNNTKPDKPKVVEDTRAVVAIPAIIMAQSRVIPIITMARNRVRMTIRVNLTLKISMMAVLTKLVMICMVVSKTI